MADPEGGDAAAIDEPDWWEDRLEALLTRLASERAEDNFALRRSSASDKENVLAPAGAEAALTLLPGWSLGEAGSALRRRMELESPNGATALLATVHALVGGERYRPRVRSAIRDNAIELSVCAPEVEGLPVWLLALGIRLDELLRPATSEELEPAPLELIRDWIQERDPEWTFRPERGEIVGPFFFDGGCQALSFACLVAAMAHLQRHLVRLAVEVDGDVVRVGLASAGGGALTNGALVYSSVIGDLAEAEGAREPKGDAQLLAALTVGRGEEGQELGLRLGRDGDREASDR